MEGGITDAERSTMLRAAVSRVGRDELKGALDRSSFPHAQIPKAVVNAINALRKHRDPAAVVGSTQYRAALPYVAAAVADPCLERTIEVLGEHSDDPTRGQLEAALATVGDEFPDAVVAVMLASVADAGMPASDLCFDLLATEERFGLTDWSTLVSRPTTTPKAAKPTGGATPEQRQERRLKKQKDAEDRRRKQEAARQAGDRLRQARKKDRTQASDAPGRSSDAPSGPPTGVAPRLTRRATLTPLQDKEFDRDDPWTAGVVFAWVPFDATGPGAPGTEGKVRPCVVVAGSPTHLLVRAGYSEGGVKSRDWKSVPLRHWRKSGFDQPTWIDIEMLSVPREADHSPVGWLSADDWNALW